MLVSQTQDRYKTAKFPTHVSLKSELTFVAVHSLTYEELKVRHYNLWGHKNFSLRHPRCDLLVNQCDSLIDTVIESDGDAKIAF